MWVQDAARRMAEEQAALEAKVFHTRPRLPPQHTTVTQPFSLSSAEAQVRSVLKCVWRGGNSETQIRFGPARQRFSTAVQALERFLSWLTACCRPSREQHVFTARLMTTCDSCGSGVWLQERSRTRQAQLAGRAAIVRAKTCPFRPNAAAELEVIEALLTQDDS